MVALTDLTDLLKEWYHEQEVIYQTFGGHPFMDSLTRNPNAGGQGDPVPIIVGESQGIANTAYTTATANAGAPTNAQFLVTYAHQDVVSKFDNVVVKGAVKKPHAFVDTVKKNNDATLTRAGNDMSAQIWGNGGGHLGIISTITTSTNTIVLTDVRQAINFTPGMKIVVSDDDGSAAGHSLRDTGAAVTITSVNRNTGTIIYSGTDISGAAIGDYIFRQGSFAGDVSQTALIVGMQKWIPYTAPTDTLFSQLRTGQSLLFGCSSSGVTDVEAGNDVDRISKFAAFHNTQYGATPRDCWVTPKRWNRIAITMQQKGMRPINMSNWTGTVGYKAIEFADASFELYLRNDRHCPDGYAYLVTPEHVELRSIGEIMAPLMEDGLDLRWDTTNGKWQYDWQSDLQLVIDNPAAHGVCLLTA